jgi:outer membrane protein TolC
VILRVTDALAGAQLRPGADTSRASAELAAARTQMIRAQQAVEIARATVAQLVGVQPAQVAISAPQLLRLPPDQAVPPLDPPRNPIALEQNAVIERTRAELHALARSYFPRFYAQLSAYARGTGAETDGSRLGGLNGLAPTVQNAGVGFSVTFPIFDLPAIHAKEAVQSAKIRAESARFEEIAAESARFEEIAAELRAQWNRAVATLQGSRQIAANTPVQVSAARAATQQATARYEAGLGAIDQVADAQRLLTQAEIDDALARLGVWRGLLGVAAAAGDIQPFIAEVGR